MKKSLLLLLFFSTTLISKAQKRPTDANIVGDVQCNGEHLSYINIVLKGTTIGTITDKTGHFQLINLAEGFYTLEASGVGFKPEQRKVEVKKDETIEVKFKLEEDVLNLEGVVVSADRNRLSRKEAPVIVNSLTPQLFESVQAVGVSDGLDFSPGLRMENNCQNCGFSQLRMNGLDGPYTQVLINSRPVFSGLAGVYGLELFPANMVDRVEVVRGGGSALFGGNAIAGIVNIITKEPRTNTFNLDTRLGFVGTGHPEGSGSAKDKLLNINGSFVTDDLKSGLFYYGSVRDRNEFDENGDGFSEIVQMKNTTLGFNAFHKFSQSSKLSLDFYRINEFRRGGNMFDHLPHEADIAEQVDHTITGGNITFDQFISGNNVNKLTFYAAGQHVNRQSYYGAEQDPNGYGVTEDLTSSLGGQYLMNFQSGSSFIVGIDNNYNWIEDTKLGSNGNENSTIVNQYINTFGSFAQYDWRNARSALSIGLRYDQFWIRDLDKENSSDLLSTNYDGGVFAPRITYKYDFSPVVHYRLSYAKGYRAPQIFDEDLHIEVSGARKILHSNADNLIQETSHTFNSSMGYTGAIGNVLTEVLVEGFYTRLLDAFTYEYDFDEATKTMMQTRTNAEDGAFVAGLNTEFNAVLSRSLKMQLGLTIQTSQYDSEQAWGEDPGSTSKFFMRAPNQYGYGMLDWQISKHFETSFTYNFTGSMYVPHFGLSPITAEEQTLIEEGNISTIEPDRQNEINAILNGEVIEGERLEKTEHFHIFGIRMSYTMPLSKEMNMQIYAGVQNIFNQTQARHDRGIYRDAGYIYGPGRPRTINIGLKFGNIF